MENLKINKHNYTDLIKDKVNNLNKLEGFDKRWLKHGLYTQCQCGITTKLTNYPNHCNSKQHQNYLNKNNITNIFTIQDIY
jgi:hypothetical protein